MMMMMISVATQVYPMMMMMMMMMISVVTPAYPMMMMMTMDQLPAECILSALFLIQPT